MKSPSMVQVASEEDADRPVKVFMDMDHPTPTTPALSPKVPDIRSLSIQLPLFTVPRILQLYHVPFPWR
jgi:hypothetical protein